MASLHSRTMRVLAMSVALALGLVLAGAGTASAHVSVDAGSARQGEDDALLTFRVPNERTDARTVMVDIKFPVKTPLASVKPAAKTGWAVTTKRTTLATPITTADGDITQGVAEVIYKADSTADGIPEDTFETFQMLVGPLPSGVATIAFPTVQTYSNGDISSWIEPAVAGMEPAHPAPVLRLAPAEETSSSDGAGVSGGASDDPDAPATRQQVRTASFIGLVGVVVGSAGLLGAGVAIGRSRRQPGPPTDPAG